MDRLVQKESHFFDFNLKYLHYLGLWPRKDTTRTKRILYYIYEFNLHLLSLIFLIITGVGSYEHRDDTVALLKNLDITLAGYNFVFKVIVFVYRRRGITKLIEEIVASGDTITEDHKALMAKLVIVVTSIGTLIVTAITSMAIYEGEITIAAWMPFDPLKNRMNLLASTQILAAMFIPVAYRGFAMLGIVCSLILYMRDQLVDLQQKIRQLEFVPENEDQLRQDLKIIIKKHIRLLKYSKTIEILFMEYFFIQNIVVTVELCFNAMMISMVGWQNKTLCMSFLAFLFVALLNAYVYCYLGDELIVQSEGIATAAYESSWTTWPVHMQKNLLMVITAAQIPMKLSAGGITVLSVQSYSQTLYNGYSIFAVLSDMVD